jgi:biopolymer transport protein ExbD
VSNLRRKRRRRFEPNAQMNLTSLIDVVFILLVAFMIVAPVLKQGINVDLAKVEGGEPLTPARPVSVVIDFEPGDDEPRIYFDEDRISLDRLRTRLQARLDFSLSTDEEISVLIEPDAQVPTEVTLQVLAIVIDVGVTNYGFVTEPPERD